MQYEIVQTARFRKELKQIVRRGYNLQLMDEVVEKLAARTSLDKKHRDHALSGRWSGYRECHITSDWLLIYQIFDDVLVLSLSRTGTHADLALE